MSVYVDVPMWKFKHGGRRMIMCHMTADSHDELIAMADKIGVQRKWIQYRGTWKEHFDVCKTKRALAVKYGAIELDKHQAAEHIARRHAAARMAVSAEKAAEPWWVT